MLTHNSRKNISRGHGVKYLSSKLRNYEYGRQTSIFLIVYIPLQNVPQHEILSYIILFVYLVYSIDFVVGVAVPLTSQLLTLGWKPDMFRVTVITHSF